MRSRVKTGDECPRGSSVFQTTFFLGPNSNGSPVEVETPLPFGPRNCVQSSASAVGNVTMKVSSKRASVIIGFNMIDEVFLSD